MLLRHLALPALLLAAAACSVDSSSDDPEVNDAAITDAQTECTPAAYDQALASYKKAVAKSKDRLSKGACESDDGLLSSIVADAHAAVTTCAAFENVIKTSVWAQPIRDALKGNLALAALTGELDTKTWAGAQKALVGTTFYGPASGAYGNMSKVELGELGVAYVRQLVFDDNDTPLWITQPKGSFEIGRPTATGALPIILRYGVMYGRPEYELTYELRMDPERPGGFILKPTTADAPPGGYTSFPSECEA